MENNFHSLATESFSYSWLANPNPSSTIASLVNNHDHPDHNFIFDVCLSESIVHADKIISNGVIIPLFVDPSKEKERLMNTSDFFPRYSSSSSCRVLASSSTRSWKIIPRKWRGSSKDIVIKWLRFFRLNWSPSGSRRCMRVDDLERRSREVITSRSTISSPEVSPARSSTTSYCSRGTSNDPESSVYEAILYCKKSIGDMI
ncbi:hypothetical protein Droror1_Dr00004875 [Drosera rotundifolia]